jgi:SH3-like domain-containing protein
MKQIFIYSLLCVLFANCAQTGLPTNVVYFVKPPITYLREQPDLASKPVIEVYKGDQLESLDGNEKVWIKVKSARKDMMGWIPADLVTSSQIGKEIYYVNKETVTVHQSPSQNSPKIKSLVFGSKVQKIEELPNGWWRILEEDKGLFGWVPAESLAAKPPVQQKLTQLNSKSCFVAGVQVSLHRLPLRDSQVIKVLALNDKAEILAQEGAWTKIKMMETAAEGWVLSAMLKPTPVTQTDKKRKRTTPKSRGPSKAKPELDIM